MLLAFIVVPWGLSRPRLDNRVRFAGSLTGSPLYKRLEHPSGDKKAPPDGIYNGKQMTQFITTPALVDRGKTVGEFFQ